MSHKGESLREAKERLLRGIGAPKKVTFVADDFQREAIESVVTGNDTLVVAPTGAGKTYIATEAINATLAQNGRAVYTTPLKALSNTKFNELKRRFEPEYKVGLLTGDRKIEGDADAVVATTEIYRNELYRGKVNYGLVILDEVHYISDQFRGAVWEESIILTPTSSALLMLSASISNAEEIAEWIGSVRKRPCRIVSMKVRPVELRFGFIHPDLGVLPIDDGHGAIFHEIKKYYGDSTLDPTGMKLKGGAYERRFSGGGFRNNNRRGRGKRRR